MENSGYRLLAICFRGVQTESCLYSASNSIESCHPVLYNWLWFASLGGIFEYSTPNDENGVFCSYNKLVENALLQIQVVTEYTASDMCSPNCFGFGLQRASGALNFRPLTHRKRSRLMSLGFMNTRIQWISGVFKKYNFLNHSAYKQKLKETGEQCLDPNLHHRSE